MSCQADKFAQKVASGELKTPTPIYVADVLIGFEIYMSDSSSFILYKENDEICIFADCPDSTEEIEIPKILQEAGVTA